MNMKKVGCVYPNKKKSFRGAWRAQPPKRVAALPICASPAASNPTQRFIPISKVARCWQSDRAFRVGKHTESLHFNKQGMIFLLYITNLLTCTHLLFTENMTIHYAPTLTSAI